jgi:hypothetical protein
MKMKSIKIFLLAFITISLASAWSQSNTDLLELEDIIILGKAHGFTDSLKSGTEDYRYTRKSSFSEFKIEPSLKTFKIDKIESSCQPDRLFWKLSGGNNSMLFSRLAYAANNNSLLSFSADFYHKSYEKNYEYRNYAIYWLPELKHKNAVVSFSQNLYDLPKVRTTATMGSICLPDWQIYSGDYGSAKLNSSLAYANYEQIISGYSADTKQEIYGLANLDFKKSRLFAGVSTEIKSAGSIAATWIGSNEYLIDKFGFWLAADNRHLYPSLIYSQTYCPGSNITIFLQNKPQAVTENLKQKLEDNHYLDISQAQRQAKYLVNNDLGISYETNLIFGLNWNTRYVIDKINYLMIAHPNEELNVFYETQYKKTWENEFSARIDYQYQNFDFSHKAYYTIYEKDFFFLPRFQLLNLVAYKYSKLNSVLAARYNSGRLDDDHNYMPDCLALDIMLEWEINELIKINLQVENIADKENRIYNPSPAEKLTIMGGFVLNL